MAFWRCIGVFEGALTGIRCVWKVVVEAFLGCCGILMCVLGSLGAFELLWVSLEGDIGGVSGLLGARWGRFMGCLGVLGHFGI